MLTQSQNSSAKTSIIVYDGFLNDWKLRNRQNFDWNALDDCLSTMHRAVVFKRNLFFSATLIAAVEKLTDTGIMTHLIDSFWNQKKKIFQKLSQNRMF